MLNKIVEMEGVSKSFGSIQALDSVDLSLYEGEILGLVGDNAAGKSTLMKILTGFYQADKGNIIIQGQAIDIENYDPQKSRQMGIEMVYQDLEVPPNLDVKSIVFLGNEPARKDFLGKCFGFLDRKKMAKKAGRVLSELDLGDLSTEQVMRTLSGGQHQAVTIAKCVRCNPKLIILDEPTSNLSAGKIDQLLDVIKSLKRNGISVIMVSHRFQEIFMVADRIVVLRQGKKVGDKNAEEVEMDEILKMSIGHTVESQ